jgi:hypothetical protein
MMTVLDTFQDPSSILGGSTKFYGSVKVSIGSLRGTRVSRGATHVNQKKTIKGNETLALSMAA